MATLNQYDIGGAAMQGFQQGRAIRNQNQLNQLASQAYSTAPEGQNALLGQIAQISPQAAAAQQQQFQQGEDRTADQLRGLVRFIDDARATGDEKRVNAALQSAGPFIQKLTGRAPPTQWTEDFTPGWEQLRAKVAMLTPQGQLVEPTGFREIDMKLKAAGYQPGSPEYQEGMRIATGQQGRAATGGFGFEQVRGPDGMMRIQRTNPRTGAVEIYDEQTGDFTPVGGGAPINGGSPQASAAIGSDHIANFQGLAGAFPGTQITSLNRSQADNARVGGVSNSQHLRGTAGDFVVPAPQRQAFMAQARSLGYEAIDEGDHIHLELPPGSQVAQAGGNQFQNTRAVTNRLAVGRSPEQEAAAVTAAREGAELSFLPERGRLENQAALDRAAGLQRLEGAAETMSSAPGAIATIQQSIDSIDALLNSDNLGSIVGLGYVNPLNQIPGSAGRGLIARADQVGGQAFLAAFNQLKGGGAITEKEGEAATRAMARLDRTQNEADYRAALRDLKSAVTPAIQRQREALSRAQQTVGGVSTSAPVQRARNPQTGEVLELRNGQWVPAR